MNKTNLFVCVAAALLVAGCEEEKPITPEQPTPEPWQYPAFSGDGLPASEDTDHNTYDSNADDDDDDPVDEDGDGEEPEVQIDVQDGLFGWSKTTTGGGPGPLADPQVETFTATLVLLDKSLGCYDLFSNLDSFNPNGIYFTLQPALAEDGSALWEGEYRDCGRRDELPCFTNSYAISGGEYADLGPRATITVQSYDAHYLTVDWNTDVSEGSNLKFYNCGQKSSWYY